MVKFVDPTPSPMSNEQIMELADLCREKSGHELGRTTRELIRRMGGIIDAPNVELAIGPYQLAEGPGDKFLIRSNAGLSVRARVMNEATALGHYVLHRPEQEKQDSYLLVMAPTLSDSGEVLECRRQARLYATSFLVPRPVLAAMIEDGRDLDEISDFFKIQHSDVIFLATTAQMGVNMPSFNPEILQNDELDPCL